MAAQKDMQDLLRLLTTGRNKLPMLDAMRRVKALQDAGLKSISDIASTTLPTLKPIIPDEKAAKSLLAACKSHQKSPSDSLATKRSSDSSLPSSKRTKSAYSLDSEPQTPQELEASLALPQPSEDEEAISKCTIYTNRAPLVLAFAVQLLKYTMPEQPLSSRLSLGQAVVSVNSKSKAVAIGIEKGKSAEEQGWGMGQPKVRVLGREVSVLKRSGYEWREEVKVEEGEGDSQGTLKEESSQDLATKPKYTSPEMGKWTVSAPITSKKSTFIARSIEVTTPTQAKNAISTLLSSTPELRSADHNIYAYRVRTLGTGNTIENSNDDGENGGGRHLLGILQADNLTNVLLVVTRWYGGIFLGPDRWRIMTDVSRDALSQRLRVAGVIGQEALWGLDLDAMSNAAPGVMPVHRPEGARNYILKAFGNPPEKEEEGKKGKKKTLRQVEGEKEENLGLLLGALDMLFASWKGHASGEELDRRAWGWYVGVRPEVADGKAGWGGKGEVKLADILGKRRKG